MDRYPEKRPAGTSQEQHSCPLNSVEVSLHRVFIRPTKMGQQLLMLRVQMSLQAWDRTVEKDQQPLNIYPRPGSSIRSSVSFPA